MRPTLAALLSALTLSALSSPSVAFLSHNRVRHQSKGFATWDSLRLKSALVEPEGETVSSFTDASAELTQKLSKDGVELWLDLRGTAILPVAALSHLSDDLWGDFEALKARGNRFVDRVLVSEANAQEALQHMDNRNQGTDVADVVFVRDEDDVVIDARDRSNIVGRLVSLKNNEMVDPIPAMDCMSLGGWTLVDSSDIKDDEKKQEAVDGLVEFLSASATPGVGLMVGSEARAVQGYGRNKDDEKEACGGIVLCCHSKRDLLNSGALFQSSQAGSYTETDSGILVQTENAADVADDNIVADAPAFKSAVAIPFDVNMWKTASFVFGGFSDSELNS
uniref:Uncharacterized protein n=1 Tax=Odontella aurita TaxID=265563 RepID=A0A7S4JRR4_9STRA|mmetsp:Transcript_52561/g.157528  ORF Transcript_52561/g.157528 Transcript_52561/m.157528 type:complete len:336 (+) Transcript_52561:54-1061(+)